MRGICLIQKRHTFAMKAYASSDYKWSVALHSSILLVYISFFLHSHKCTKCLNFRIGAIFYELIVISRYVPPKMKMG